MDKASEKMVVKLNWADDGTAEPEDIKRAFKAGAEWQKKQPDKAIEFADWISGEGYQQYDGVGRWIAPQNNNNVYTTKELYEQFLQSLK